MLGVWGGGRRLRQPPRGGAPASDAGQGEGGGLALPSPAFIQLQEQPALVVRQLSSGLPAEEGVEGIVHVEGGVHVGSGVHVESGVRVENNVYVEAGVHLESGVFACRLLGCRSRKAVVGNPHCYCLTDHYLLLSDYRNRNIWNFLCKP